MNLISKLFAPDDLVTISSRADGSSSVSADASKANPGDTNDQACTSSSLLAFSSKTSPTVIMLAEDNPGDVELVNEAISLT